MTEPRGECSEANVASPVIVHGGRVSMCVCQGGGKLGGLPGGRHREEDSPYAYLG